MSKFLFGLNLGMKARRKTSGDGGKVVFFWREGRETTTRKSASRVPLLLRLTHLIS